MPAASVASTIAPAAIAPAPSPSATIAAAPSASALLSASAAPSTSADVNEGRLGRERRAEGLKIHREQLSVLTDLLRCVQTPAPGRSAEIEHAHPSFEEADAPIDLLELVDAPRGKTSLFG